MAENNNKSNGNDVDTNTDISNGTTPNETNGTTTNIDDDNNPTPNESNADNKEDPISTPNRSNSNTSNTSLNTIKNNNTVSTPTTAGRKMAARMQMKLGNLHRMHEAMLGSLQNLVTPTENPPQVTEIVISLYTL